MRLGFCLDCFASLAMTVRARHCEERSDEAIQLADARDMLRVAFTPPQWFMRLVRIAPSRRYFWSHTCRIQLSLTPRTVMITPVMAMPATLITAALRPP